MCKETRAENEQVELQRGWWWTLARHAPQGSNLWADSKKIAFKGSVRPTRQQIVFFLTLTFSGSLPRRWTFYSSLRFVLPLPFRWSWTEFCLQWSENCKMAFGKTLTQKQYLLTLDNPLPSLWTVICIILSHTSVFVCLIFSHFGQKLCFSGMSTSSCLV